ncbi:MAG: lytic transglycosylase domain-containing protein [Pseudomonadota bacterium]
MCKIAFVAIVFLLMTAQSAFGHDWESSFREPCQEFKIPIELAMAIAKHESGFNPWAINIAGKGFLPTSKAEAQVLIKQAQQRKQSFDVGLMQINNWWLERLHISPEIALLPQNNIRLGLWILAQEIQRYGFSWQAVGAYHSPHKKRQQVYAYAVSQHYQRFIAEEK